MENVPWHQDVKDFAEAMVVASKGEYELACEHVHSCCVLLAKASKFKIEGAWHTWIDYEKFHDLVLIQPFLFELVLLKLVPVASNLMRNSSEILRIM
jgi:wyosine [tRNA(Phe)-imidazoG37] synthetase (radical SAM superfamily)